MTETENAEQPSNRHDALVLKLRAEGRAVAVLLPAVSSLFHAAADALEQSIAAHEKTRRERNDATKHVNILIGNLRGLDAKIARLEHALDESKASEREAWSESAEVLHSALAAQKAKIAEAIEVLQR